MEFTLLEKLSSFGIGAILAGIVLYWKKQDDITYHNNLKTYLEESLKREQHLLDLVKLQIETLQTLKNTISILDVYTKIDKKLNER